MTFVSLDILNKPGKDRGIFAGENIPADCVIEVAPVIVMTKKDRVLLDQTKLHDYIFEWGIKRDQCCMALGYIPIYNHSYTSNAEYVMDFDSRQMMIRSLRCITAGEEITINYNGNWNDPKKVWFEVI